MSTGTTSSNQGDICPGCTLNRWELFRLDIQIEVCQMCGALKCFKCNATTPRDINRCPLWTTDAQFGIPTECKLMLCLKCWTAHKMAHEMLEAFK